MKLRGSVFVFVVLLAGILSGFQKNAPVCFLKGNLHTHSYWSDGNTYPEEVVRWYRDHGYQFLAITDHDILQQGVKTRILGGDTVILRELADYRHEFEKQGEFLLLSAEEISDKSEKKPVHLNAFNLNQAVKPTGGATVSECLNANVRAIRQALEFSGNPEWITVNHPNFGWSLTTDDAHQYDVFEAGKANPGRGWTMVRARELTPGALYAAMFAGDFYASTGIELLDFRNNKKKITIRIRGEKGIHYSTEFIGWLAGRDHAEILKTVEGTKAVYRASGKELFVRARIVSGKPKQNPFAKGDYEMAWLQPVVFL